MFNSKKSEFEGQIQCRWCRNATSVVLCNAVVAPWITDRGSPSIQSNEISSYCHCKSCGLFFFTHIYSEFQLARMYEGYRGKEYQILRSRYEPWYTKRKNWKIGNDEKEIQLRKQILLGLVNHALKNGTMSPPEVVVDWGGDRGQFIPDFVGNRKKAVYEISSANAVDGVERIESVEDIRFIQPNFVMVCHVLEHDNNPLATIELISSVMPVRGTLYIEVPKDAIGVSPKTNWSDRSLLFFSNHRYLFMLLDFYSLISLRVLKLRMPMQILKQSEHVNFFNRDALVKVMTSKGFVCIDEIEYSRRRIFGIKGAQSIGVLFEKNV